MRCWASAGASLLLFAALSACGTASDSAGAGGEVVASANAPIIGGKVSPSSQDAVVLLVHSDFKTYQAGCTATLLAPNLLLTARHCVSETVDEPFICRANGTVLGQGGRITGDRNVADLYVFAGSTRPDLKKGAPATSARGKEIIHDGASNVCGHDLALLVLDRDIANASIAPVRLDAPPVPGERLTAVGWGITATTTSPGMRQQRPDIVVTAVGPVDDELTQLGANDFQVGESICQGDSGGPMLSESGAVVGVVSRGGNGRSSETEPAAGCTGADTLNEMTKVAAFKSLVLEAYARAGADPWPEGGIDPRLGKLGDSCDDDGACRSNLCASGRCANTCSRAEPCPESFVCEVEGDRRVCKPVATGEGGGLFGCSTAGGAGGPAGELVLAGAAAAVLIGLRRRARQKV